MKMQVFKNGMGALTQALPDKKMDFNIYWRFLNDLEDKDFLKAIKNIVTSSIDIYPGTNMIALIRDKALNDDKITAGEAWAKVLAAVSSIGSWGVPDFKDDLIRRAVDGVGWKSICMSEMIGVERAHFIKIYDSIEKRDKVGNTVIASDNKEVRSLVNDIAAKLGCNKDK